MLVNYMTTHIESVKLSRDFVVIQHFRFCKLFSKHVFLDVFSTGTPRVVLKSAIYILCQRLYRLIELEFQRGKPLHV